MRRCVRINSHFLDVASVFTDLVIIVLSLQPLLSRHSESSVQAHTYGADAQ